MYTRFIHLSGYANLSAGLLLLAFWYLYAILLPYRQLSSTLSILVLDKNWTFVNILGTGGAVISLLGLVGIFLSFGEKASNFALAGFIIAFLGTVLFMATLFWETLIWPILAQHDSSLLDFQGPIYSSKTYIPYFITAGLFYSLGFLLLGLAIAQSGLYPYWAGILIAVGGPLFGLGAMFGNRQVYVRSVGITLLCIGMIWVGNLMRTMKY